MPCVAEFSSCTRLSLLLSLGHCSYSLDCPAMFPRHLADLHDGCFGVADHPTVTAANSDQVFALPATAWAPSAAFAHPCPSAHHRSDLSADLCSRGCALHALAKVQSCPYLSYTLCSYGPFEIVYLAHADVPLFPCSLAPTATKHLFLLLHALRWIVYSGQKVLRALGAVVGYLLMMSFAPVSFYWVLQGSPNGVDIARLTTSASLA